MTEHIVAFSVPPVVKTVTVRANPAEAFRMFTADLAAWWPLARVHVAPDPETCVLECFEGGRVYERARNGEESLWGVVEAWDPPSRLAFTWQVGLAADETQHVEVTFRQASAGTQVTLVHAGWEKLGERALDRRGKYDKGWVTVFEQSYAAYAGG
jgi:uncharacterized protein YndB with AHSA1/START domain